VLKIVGEPFTEEYYGIAVQKGNAELLALINQGLASVRAVGRARASSRTSG
jgi:polar amino acid transport system substrate-binding protein